MDVLECSAIVFRAMARKNWVDRTTNRILPAAFMRRPAPKDDDGLSVDVASAESCRGSLREVFGVASLHVGRIRDLGLDVVVDEAPHANIVDLPRASHDRTQAERLASQLARQARLIV